MKCEKVYSTSLTVQIQHCCCSSAMLITVACPGFEIICYNHNRNVSVGSNKVILLSMHDYSGKTTSTSFFPILAH